MKLLNGWFAENSEIYTVLTEIIRKIRKEEIELLKLLNEARRGQGRLTLKLAFKMLDRGETDG